MNVINGLVREKATTGDKDINLQKLDPLPIANMNIKQGAESPVNIDLTFKNNLAHGISTMKFTKVRWVALK